MENIINDIERNAEHGEKQREGAFLLLRTSIIEGVEKTIRRYFDDATFVSSKMAAIGMAKNLDFGVLAQEMQDDLTELLEAEKEGKEG